MLLVTGAIAGIALLLWPTREREPEYRGRKLREWVFWFAYEKLAASGDESNIGAEQAIRQIGTNALPVLLEDLDYDGSSVLVNRIQELGGKLPEFVTTKGFHDWCSGRPNVMRREYACIAFQGLGEMAKPAIPELTRRLNGKKHSNRAFYAADAMIYMGGPAFPVLEFQLTNGNALNCKVAIAELGHLAKYTTNCSSFIPIVANCAAKSTGADRRETVYALAQMARANPKNEEPVLSLLTQELEIEFTNEWVGIRVSFAQALGAYGTRARASVPALQRAAALDGTNYVELRIAATDALSKIAPEVFTNSPPK